MGGWGGGVGRGGVVRVGSTPAEEPWVHYPVRGSEDAEDLKAARRWDAGVNDGCLSCSEDEQLAAS